MQNDSKTRLGVQLRLIAIRASAQLASARTQARAEHREQRVGEADISIALFADGLYLMDTKQRGERGLEPDVTIEELDAADQEHFRSVRERLNALRDAVAQQKEQGDQDRAAGLVTQVLCRWRERF